MSETNDDFAKEVLKAAEAAQAFGVAGGREIHYDKDGRCVRYLQNSEECWAEQVDSNITIYWGRYSGDFVGFMVNVPCQVPPAYTSEPRPLPFITGMTKVGDHPPAPDQQSDHTVPGGEYAHPIELLELPTPFEYGQREARGLVKEVFAKNAHLFDRLKPKQAKEEAYRCFDEGRAKLKIMDVYEDAAPVAPLNFALVNAAWLLVCDVGRWLETSNAKIPMPHIGTTASGGIIFEWMDFDIQGREMAVAIRSTDGAVKCMCLVVDDTTGYDVEEEIKDYGRIHSHLLWLIGGNPQ